MSSETTQAPSLEPEDIVENQKIVMQQLAKENAQLKEELRIARSDNDTLKEAIVNAFVADWALGGRG